jgi:hypothetical protein
MSAQRANRFRNPSNGYEENVGAAWLWCLLLGPIYFVFKGIWSHAALSLLLVIATAYVFPFPWFIYPFFANGIVRKHYLRDGWVAEVQDQPPRTETMKSTGKSLIAIGWIYILLVMVFQWAHWYQTGGWSRFLHISDNLKDAVVFFLIMLPGIGLHMIGYKLQETAAKDDLRERLRNLERQ